MKIVKALFVLCILSSTGYAQGLLRQYNGVGTSDLEGSYTELYAGTGMGSMIGINHFKSLTSRTSIGIGASYGSFRMYSMNNSEVTGRNFVNYANLRTELRYRLTREEKPLTAYVYAALNNGYANFPGRPGYNLNLEVGGEVRYKIAENVYFFARTSFYRQSGYGNPAVMYPYGVPSR